MQAVWEPVSIDHTTHRIEVPGGWLYRCIVATKVVYGMREPTVAMCFVPNTDPSRSPTMPAHMNVGEDIL